MNRQLLNQVSQLSVDERLELVEAIWDTIDPTEIPLTEAQQQELDRRLNDHLDHPDDVVPWEEVKAEALARLRQ